MFLMSQNHSAAERSLASELGTTEWDEGSPQGQKERPLEKCPFSEVGRGKRGREPFRTVLNLNGITTTLPRELCLLWKCLY